jgi:hypothetical protein
VNRLPNFIYVGPDKAGSSWLHEVLLRHPEVFLSPAKDLYFFDRYYQRGLHWYAQQFTGAGPQHKIVGEICQDYLFDHRAPARMHRDLGGIRSMVSLRDPVERAWSSFLYARKHGMFEETFSDSLRAHPELVEHGRYASGLRRMLEFFPRDSIHVAVFEDLREDPQRFLDATTDFLGVARLPLSDEDQQPRLSAAAARAPWAAHAARLAADWVREHDGARLVGAVKRSSLVHQILYKPLDKSTLRPAAADVAFIREALAGEVDSLEREFGLPVRSRWGW